MAMGLRCSINDQDANCVVCGNLSKTRCSLCKVATYCSGSCRIKHWKSGHKDECIEKDNTADQVTRPADAAFESKFLNKHELGEMAHEQIKEQVRYLEEELLNSRNEIELLQSECDNWKMRAEFVSRRLNSFLKKSDQIAVEESIDEMIKQEEHIKMLKTERATAKSELQTERKRVQRLTLELEETAHTAIIKVEEARVAEMRKQEKCIRMMMAELAKTRRNLQEERKHDETKQIAIKKVEELGQDLANARNDLASAIHRAEVAEAKLSDLEKKIKLTEDKHVCAICLNNENDMAFGCGHMTCRDCGLDISISMCPICRKQITSRIRLFPG